MKPLTIDELKALKVGDWVWYKFIGYNADSYRQIRAKNDSGIDFLSTAFSDYNTYGVEWVCWKNKEQAEAKGTIVELPKRVNDDVIFIDISDGEPNAKLITGYLIHHYEIRSFELVIIVLYNPYTDERYEVAASHLGLWWFVDEKEAEKRLAELKGESDD